MERLKVSDSNIKYLSTLRNRDQDTVTRVLNKLITDHKVRIKQDEKTK